MATGAPAAVRARDHRIGGHCARLCASGNRCRWVGSAVWLANQMYAPCATSECGRCHVSTGNRSMLSTGSRHNSNALCDQCCAFTCRSLLLTPNADNNRQIDWWRMKSILWRNSSDNSFPVTMIHNMSPIFHVDRRMCLSAFVSVCDEGAMVATDSDLTEPIDGLWITFDCIDSVRAISL